MFIKLFIKLLKLLIHVYWYSYKKIHNIGKNIKFFIDIMLNII